MFSGVLKESAKIAPEEFCKLYTTGKVLGKGGFGTVYGGHRNSDHLPVAIKMIAKGRAQMVSIKNPRWGTADSETTTPEFVKVSLVDIVQTLTLPKYSCNVMPTNRLFDVMSCNCNTKKNNMFQSFVQLKEKLFVGIKDKR